MTEVQRSVVIGTVLGDGSMRCKVNALLEINHGYAQKGYVDWKYSVLQPLVTTAPAVRITNGGRLAYRFVTRSLPELTPYYQSFYASGRKAVSDTVLTPLALAVWFMDDGSKSRSTVYLNTQQFDIASQKQLIAMLQRDFGIAATLNADKKYKRIRIAVASIERFKACVAKYVLPAMRYKLP